MKLRTILILTLVLVGTVQAQTNVGPTVISGPEIWDKDGDPYNITGTVTIASTGKLTNDDKHAGAMGSRNFLDLTGYETVCSVELRQHVTWFAGRRVELEGSMHKQYKWT